MGRWWNNRLGVMLLLLAVGLSSPLVHAACGATDLTWDAGAGSTAWGTANNWNPNNIPNVTTENAIILSGTRVTNFNGNYSIGCLEVRSGQLINSTANTLTINGDYFRNLTVDGMAITGTGFVVVMAGTAAQTFENVDSIPNLRISNNTTVTLTKPFTITTSFQITGTTTTVYIDDDLNLAAGVGAVTIPVGTTVHLRSGATLTANNNVTVNGSLILDDGTSLVMGNGRTLSVASTGNLQLNGTSGSTARITGAGTGSTFTFNMAGIMTANYFRIDRTAATGLNVTGTIQSMGNGEFHYPASAGVAITLGAAAVLPTTLDNLSFYDDSGFANVKNINATAYTGTVRTLNNWSGGTGGATYETDPGNKITWGTQAGTQLVLSNNTASGSPPTTVAQSSGDTLFATFALSLNQASTLTNITSVKVTMTGSGNSSDVAYVKLFRDALAGTNCVYNAGVDTQIGSNQSLSGSPASTTFTIPSGDVTTNGPTIVCLHVVAGTTSTAQDAKTIRFSISSTADVVNSQNYSFSPSSGPPIDAGQTTIVGDATRIWQGDTSTAWATGGNWQATGVPTSALDCNVGVGTRIAALSGASACQNMTLQTGGTIDFVAANELAAYASLTVQSGFTFNNATTGILAVRGVNNQIVDISTTFPGNFLVANTGVSPNNVVTVNRSATINGNLTVTSGVLSISSGVTLTVGGNVTVQTGAMLEILPGGTLALGNGSVVTVNAGGILKMVGTSGSSANMTSTSVANAYSVVVNGEIRAQYYSFDRLGVNGVSIESAATINASYYLQNGSFAYPVNNSSTLLKLKRQVPGNTLAGMSFSKNGSSATGTINIDTTGAGAGTLSITSYSGDLGGPTFDNDPTYAISWSGATNTIDITREASGPTSVDAGATYTMGRFGFKQTLAGASYLDAGITSLKISLTGNGSASDISALRIYKSTSCTNTGGTLIGTGSFAGSPPTATFALGATDFVVAAHTTTPPMNCIYVEYDISNGASNSKTVGASIAASTDMVNNQSYLASGSTSFPVTLGTAATIVGSTNTTWTGATSTNWFTATNWSGGLPDSTKNCTINDVTNDPVINGASGTAICKNVTIGNGILTFTNATAAKMDVYGSYTSTGTVTQNDGVIRMIDGGTGSSQNIQSSSTVTNLQMEKTGGGTVSVAGTTLNVNTFTFNVGNTGKLSIPSGKTMTLANSVSIPNGTLEVGGGGVLKMANTKVITLNGGTFATTGVHDQYPQNLALKGKITVNGSGTWGFTATSGTLSLVGFQLDYLDTNGLNVGGTTNFTNFRGGHFTNLSNSYASLKVMQLNTATVPSAPSDVEWYWGPNNTPPSAVTSYLIASSTGCGGNTITFNQWFGDSFDADTQTPDPATKISQTNCTIVISYASSSVALVGFTATPYDGSVLLEWTTGSEVDHRGFNVYRSQNYGDGYIQINSELVRNKAGLGPLGNYYFEDTTAENGQLYYYMIEDVSTGGVKTKHGPVSAMPLAGLGSVPAPGSGTNTGSSQDGADSGNGLGSGPVSNSSAVDLGNGVHILAQTNSSLRVEIVPPAMSFSPSAWNGSYQEVSIPGYTKSLEAGYPELLERVILIEVTDRYSDVQVTQQNIIEGALSSPHLIQPAPSWAPDISNQLQPSYSADTTAYSSNSFSPSAYYSVAPTIKDISGKKYVEIVVNPIKFNPVLQQIKPLQKLTLDIGLGGAAWEPITPPTDLRQSPSAVPGVLRVRYEKAGMYEVQYDDLVTLGIEGYYAGAAVGDLRAYYLGTEIPIEVISADGTFNSGDSIRFWGDFVRQVDSAEAEVVIALQPLGNSVGAPLRYQDLDASPTLAPSTTMRGVETRTSFEQDLIFLNDRKMGDLADHFYWVRIAKWNSGSASYYPEHHDFSVLLPGLVRGADLNVLLDVDVRGRTQYAYEATHHFGITLNARTNYSEEATFSDYYPTSVHVPISSLDFVNGVNNVRLNVIPDLVPAGDWALLDIDRLSFTYLSDFNSVNGIKDLYKIKFDQAIPIYGFSSSAVSIYDVSDNEYPQVLRNFAVSSSDGGVSYDAAFAISKTHPSAGYHLVAIEDGAYLKPKTIALNPGFDTSLKSYNGGADLIVVGLRSYLEAASELIAKRQAEGLRVRVASLEQIYAEFSNGVPSAIAIRDYLTYAYQHGGSRKPRYVLIVGDGTQDLRDRLSKLNGKASMPVPLLSGDFNDFASDSWLAALDGESMPKMAVGRIPASNTQEVEKFVAKLLSYENGTSSPDGSRAREFGFFSDADSLFEGFSKKSDQLAASIAQSGGASTTWNKGLANYATPGDFKTEILNSFNSAPLVMSLVGHGTLDRWGDSLFLNTDAKSLSNNKLPILVGLNCSTGDFSDPDLEFKSLGESFVMNPNGGAIAYWGSSAMTVPESQVRLTEGFYEEVSGLSKVGYKTVRLGDLMLKSQARVRNIASSKDTLRSWILLGDPSMKLPQATFGENKEEDKSPGGGCGRVTLPPPGSGPGSGPWTALLILFLLPIFFEKALRRFTVQRF